MLHLDDIIELCLSLVRSEEKQNARRYVEWAAALRSRERTTLPSQGAGRSWVGPLRPASSKDAQAGTSQKPDPGCVAPSPSGTLSQMSPPEAVGARGARIPGARLETERVTPKDPWRAQGPRRVAEGGRPSL